MLRVLKDIEKKQKNKNRTLIYIEQWILEKDIASEPIKGILIRPTDDVESLAVTLNQAPLIAFDFNNFDDGISYSQVKILRKRVGYKGEIRAINVHIDHLQFIFRSGVDSYELLPQYKKYNEDYGIDFSVCYQAAENNVGLLEKHRID
ncbi:MAG: DUF934 domain-containing protein [PS1 clade bacterium]|jgi:uncharacterized protein (DUF934 family)|tara:strand:- start:247 stop:690 length:444 start_codon:yes stop_codon:yes gene_type:complete